MNNSDFFRVHIERLEKEKEVERKMAKKAAETALQSWRDVILKQMEEAYKKNVRTIRVDNNVPHMIIDELRNQGFICEPKYTESQMTNSNVLSYYQVTFPQQK
jgi:hypothetical protein